MQFYKSNLELTKKFRMMKRSNKSLVMFMSSFVDSIPLPYNTGYGSTKAFVYSFAECIKPEVAPKIDVATVRPLYIKTRLASFLPKNDPTLIEADKFVSSVLNDVEKGYFVTYGHWKHKLFGYANEKTKMGRKWCTNYFDRCNREADRFVKEYNAKQAAKAKAPKPANAEVKK
jgi:short-subunit dehydrogenase